MRYVTVSNEERKECYRLFFMVKGHLGCSHWTDDQLKSMADSYIKRVWYNEEAYIYAQGFDEAYSNLYN